MEQHEHEDMLVTNRHHSLCEGQSAKDLVFRHKDFDNTNPAVNFTKPRSVKHLPPYPPPLSLSSVGGPIWLCSNV